MTLESLFFISLAAMTVVVVIGTLGFLQVSALDREHARRERERHELLAQLGLVPAGRTPSGGETFAGLVEGQQVAYQFAYDPAGSGDRSLHHWGVSVPTRTLAVGRTLPFATRETGDPHFDRRFSVGRDLDDRTWLSPTIRNHLLLSPLSIRIWEGVLWVEAEWFEPRHLQYALQLAQLLTSGAHDPAQRLLQAAASEDEPTARLMLLDEAIATRHPARHALARALREDSDPHVRTEAMISLGEPEDLLVLISSSETSAEDKGRAARRLLALGTPQQRLAAGELLVRKGTPELHAHTIELLRSVGASGVDGLVSLLPQVDSEKLGKVVAALGEVGTVAAVPALRARQDQLSLLQLGLSHDIDRAVRKIQSRASGEHGGLAIAAPAEQQGALSVAARAGELARPKERA